jgi:hypothetical protein
MQTIYFTRQFIKGNLKGLTHADRISFPTVEACAAWVKGIKAKAAGGRLDYTIIDHSFQNYAR